MKTPSFNFSLTDFLAYFVPGVVMLIAIVFVLYMSPFNEYISKIEINGTTGFLGAVIAYYIGVILSGFTYKFEDNRYKNKNNDPRSTFSAGTELNLDINGEYNKLIGVKDSWSKEKFFVSRTLVREAFPATASAADRQNSLRQLRRNSLFPTITWGVIFFIYGIKVLLNRRIVPDYLWGAGFILFSIILTICLIKWHVITGMDRNRKRESREIYSGLILYSKQSKLKQEEDD